MPNPHNRAIARIKGVTSLRLRIWAIATRAIVKKRRSNLRGITKRRIPGRELLSSLCLCKRRGFSVLRRRFRYFADPYVSLRRNAERIGMAWMNRSLMLWTWKRKQAAYLSEERISQPSGNYGVLATIEFLSNLERSDGGGVPVDTLPLIAIPQRRNLYRFGVRSFVT